MSDEKKFWTAEDGYDPFKADPLIDRARALLVRIDTEAL